MSSYSLSKVDNPIEIETQMGKNEIRITIIIVFILCIPTNINAINGGILSLNITYLIVVSVGVITLAWVIDSNLKEATIQERSNNLLGRYFSPEVRDEIEKNKFDLNQSSEKEQNPFFPFCE